MIYDILVIGGGIAGCVSAYFLKKDGFLVALVEKDEICSKASLAAGAFLSPKIALPSPYRDYVNEALKFSLDFYEKNFPSSFKKCPLFKMPYDESDEDRLKKYEKYLNIEYKKDSKGYIFKDAGLVDPKEICEKLTENIDILKFEVKEIERTKNFFRIGKIFAKKIVVATGSEKIFDIPYIKTKEILGYRYDAEFDGMDKLDKNFHKKASISAFFKGKSVIGATHIRKKSCLDLLKAAKTDKFSLLKKANEIIDLQNLKILKIYTGSRLCTFDYFPILGEIVDFKETLKKYPSIVKGAKIPPSSFAIYDNIYIHTALASRGFVLAPYNAKMLSDLIKYGKSIDFNLSTHKRFIKFVRKNLKSVSF